MSDSSLLELLSVTDKAVKALNKSHSSHSSHGSDASITSQRSLTKDSGIKSQTENIKSKVDQVGAELSDVSTTASDVLIRSTIVENDEQQNSPSSDGSTNGAKVGSHSSGSVNGAKYSSSESKCSRTSIGVENFNSSGPQKVKISTKKLREIRSPDGSDIISPRSDVISPPLVTQKHGNIKISIPQEKPLVTRHFTGDVSDSKLQKKQSSQKSFPPNNVTTFPVRNESQNNANSDDYKKPSVDKKLGINSPVTPDDKGISPAYKNGEVFVQSSERGSSDSHEIIVERHAPKITHPTKERLIREDEETERIKRKLIELEDSLDSVDLIPQKETAILSGGSVDVSCTDSDKVSIVTIPERIVTISARSSVSTDISYTDLEGERIPPKLASNVQAPHKFSSHHLRQGAPVEGTEVQDRQKQTSDVQISQFTTSDRQKIKESLAKRQEHSGPIKRVVQPKLVNHTVTEQKRKTETSDQADTVTATVAASVAVAATAPFLKAQQELENRMKDMLAKVADLQTQKVSPAEDDRVKELERQVAALTEQRIQHLEKLQEHQVEMQAKLLGMTRSAPKRRPSSPETPMHTPITHRRPGVSNFGPNAKKAFSKTTVGRPKSTSPVRVGGSPTRSERSRICDSPYDTPNPRSRAPKPVAYNNSAIETSDTQLANHRSRGILEEILASSESPRPRLPSPEPHVPRSAYDSDLAKSPVIRKAERLVHDLSGINDDVKSVVNEIDRCKVIEEKKKQVDLKREELLGPAPLDAYLTTSSAKNFTTPYKSIPDLAPHQFNAPVPPGFSEAEQVLQDVTKTRAYLEANLQTVLRAQHEAEVYTTLENLYHNSSDPERAVLQQKVDKWVSKLRLQVEKEITDDMVIAEMQKSHLPIYKVPPPPTINATAQPVKGRGRGGPPKSDVGVAKPRAGARIDTGLGRRLAGKENKPEPSRPALKKTRAPYEDEEYMTKVYGKASYQGKRTTMRDPYLHFKNDPKQKPDRPPGVSDSKGQMVKSAKSQTSAGFKQFYFSPTHGTYIPITTGATSGPIKGNLVPMAVPLGGPRIDGGLTVPVTMTTDGLVTSTPVARTQVTAGRNVALVSIPAQNSLIDEKPAPELSKQVLPNVDIDTDLSEVSEKLQSKKSVLVSARSEKSKSEKSKSKRSKSPPKSKEKSKETQPAKQKEDTSKRSVILPSPKQSPSKVLDATFAPALKDEEADMTEVSEVYDDDFDPESAPGMELPGYRPPTPPEYREPGPSFPPKVPGHDRIMAASDVIAEDIRRKELLQNKAVEWVEQEMMARVISQMATQRTIAPPQIGHEVEEVEESISSDHENSMFLMEALGHTGLKLFIDAGVPVDTSLVNSLVKECLLEKVVTMLGQKPDDARTSMTQTRQETKMAAAAAGGSREQEETGYVREDEFGRRQVKTPQPTPKSSPVMSPVRVMSPPYTPPPSPPIEQEVPDYRGPVRVQPEYDSEISESIDISEEIRNLQGKLMQPVESSTGQIHSVETPVSTPVPDEDIKEETRPVTPPPPTPRQEVVVPKVQPQVVEVPKEIPQEPEAVPSPLKEITERATSPEPWGNPDSPLPEENPDYQDDMLDHPAPIVLTAAPGDDEMLIHPTTPPPAFRVPSPAKPGTPERPHSPAHSDDTTTIDSSISDTMNQSLSMGQWLLSKSEGEVADYILDDDLKQRIAKSSKHKGDQSVADTLRDTTDIMEESIDPVSEGEFQHRVNLSPEKDPVLHFIASLQKSPHVKQGQYEIPSNQVYDILNQTGKSMGEITMVHQNGDYRYRDQGYQGAHGDQRYREPVSHYRYGDQQYRGPVDGSYYSNQGYPGTDGSYDQYHGRQSPDRRNQDRDRYSPDQRRQSRSPGYRDTRSPEYRERDRRSPEYRERDRRSPEYRERDRRSPEYRERDRRSPDYRERESRSPEYRERDRRSPEDRARGVRSPNQREGRSPTQRGRTSPQRSAGEERRTKSSQQRRSQEMYYSNGFSPQGTRQSFNSETQDSLRASDLKRSSVEFNDVPQILSGGGRQRGRKQSPRGITVTPGGLMAGGRSPLKSAMRKPPQVQKSGGQPDRSVSKSQYQVTQVRSSDQDMKDSLEGSQNLYGFNSTGQRSSGAYTPDQMNLDALVQSGYLNQSLTYSAELGQSGNLSQSMDRSSYRDSLEYRQMSPSRTKRGQSLGLTYSFEDGEDVKGTGDLEGSGTLKMSVTLPTIEGSNSELSEIDISEKR